MPFNLISPLVDSLTGTAMEAVDTAAAAPLNPVTLTLAVAAGVVLGLLVVRCLLDAQALVNRCVQAVDTVVANKMRQRALAGKPTLSGTLTKGLKGRSATSVISAQ